MHIFQDIKLAMDGRILNVPGTGIATYAAQLRKAQSAIDPDAALIVDDACSEPPQPEPVSKIAKRWLSAKLHSDYIRLAPTARYDLYAPDIYRLAAARFRRRNRFVTLTPPAAAKAGSRGLAHWSLPLPIRVEGWINVYTIHDVIPITHPHLTPMDGDRHRRLLNILTQHADHIVTVSDYARSEIIRTTNCSPDIVTNCGISVLRRRTGSPPPQNLSRKGYFLYFGSDDARKNLDRLVTAYLSMNFDIPLVLIGNHAKYQNLSTSIYCLGHQSDEQIAAFLYNALALVFPSLAEGFGLPVIEAMTMGTAVMTSNEGALAEVAGKAALLVDPTDVAAIAEGLRRLAHDEPLRRHYEQVGPLHAARFSPDHFAKRIAALYATIASRHRDV